ncbi:increased loss of mitochondrial DNA protein 1 [Amylocarpus encephaloides]|uniref:Increased loss of mitochondrial DNA protein 1 n=1 Tax=Amylocarpus encephaloides TaxID=45428 RepID=A0A9P8C7K7_9HELO|nr:increased loss of mitochondrial DNA protein 1 [Amylocarpus encephaloides]
MALISAATIITSVSLFHLTLAYFFLTNPSQIADQTLVFIIGQAMNMPHSRAFEVASPALSFLGAVLALMGISDLAACSSREEVFVFYWGAQAPVRIFALMFLTTYSYFFSASSPLYSSASSTYTYTPSGWGEGLKNRIFFTWAFLELVTWFWIWTTLREERFEWAKRITMKRAADEEDRL